MEKEKKSDAKEGMDNLVCKLLIQWKKLVLRTEVRN